MITRYQNLIRFITDKKSLTKTKSGYSKSEPHRGKYSISGIKSDFAENNRDLRIIIVASANIDIIRNIEGETVPKPQSTTKPRTKQTFQQDNRSLLISDI